MRIDAERLSHSFPSQQAKLLQFSRRLYCDECRKVRRNACNKWRALEEQLRPIVAPTDAKCSHRKKKRRPKAPLLFLRVKL